MKIWYNHMLDTDRKVISLGKNVIRIGSDPEDNDLILDHGCIAAHAAVLANRDGQWEIKSLSQVNDIKIGDEVLQCNQVMSLKSNVDISLFPYTLNLELPNQIDISRDAQRAELDREMSDLLGTVHLQLLKLMDLDFGRDEERTQDEQYLLKLEGNIEKLVLDYGLLKPEKSRLIDHVAGQSLRSQMLVAASKKKEVANEIVKNESWNRVVSAVTQRESEIDGWITHLEKLLQIDKETNVGNKIRGIEKSFWRYWDELSDSINPDFRKYLALRILKKQVKDIVFGYGPLEDLLRLPTVSEIMVVNRDKIYIEQSGVVQNSGRRFISDEISTSIIERIVGKVGRRIDKSQPLVDARLSDGSRVNAVIPPIAVSGPCLTIRKFSDRRILIDDLIDFGALTRTTAEFLRAAVLDRKNVLISGGTGTGKTTLLNCLSDFIPDKERIVTVEDTAELNLNKQHVVRMETKDANIEGVGEYSIRDLVKNSLRMRPDRIVVGECRGAEALDMLQAMNTGHDGSMTTIHANSAQDVVLRLEVLVQMAADLPISSIHRQIVSAIDIVVQLHRMRNGRRCVSQITEIVEYDEAKKEVVTRDIYLMNDDEDPEAILAPTGRLPTFMESLIEKGYLELESFYLA